MTNQTPPNEMRSLTFKQLEAIYNVTHKTLKTWLAPFKDEIGEVRGRMFNLKQIRIIFKHLGDPTKPE